MTGWVARLLGRAHLPGCRRVEVALVGRSGGAAQMWMCARGCPKAAGRARQEIESWSGHKGR